MLVYKPVKRFMDERSARIEKEMQGAAQKLSEVQKLQEDTTASLVLENEKVAVLARSKQEEAFEQAECIIADARSQAETIIQTARAQSERERRRALLDLRDEVSVLAVNIAEKMLAREISAKDNQAFVDAFFNEEKV
jgi:F-type H+-transporting ATPase subunit b